jgi:hypothetical protein
LPALVEEIVDRAQELVQGVEETSRRAEAALGGLPSDFETSDGCVRKDEPKG